MGNTSSYQIKQANRYEKPLSMSLGTNISYFEKQFEHCDDLILRRITIGGIPVCYVYISDLVDEQSLYKLNNTAFMSEKNTANHLADIEDIINSTFPFVNIQSYESIHSLITNVLLGHIIMLAEGTKKGFVFPIGGVNGRDVEEPPSEKIVRGPRDGFVEDINTNIQLIRRKLRSPNLKVESLTLGTETNTKINIVYIKGIADDGIVEEVRSRVKRIEIDGILESHYIESMISDSRWSPFPTMYSTERPDKVCGGLLEGKVAILTDGTPFALTAPALFVEFLHSNADYYNGSFPQSIIRWVRFLGLFVTLILPAFYVALLTFHQDLLQAPFLIRIAANREGLPYPALVEGVFLLLTYELLREAGLRMASPFGGNLVTIIGLVIVGQGAVYAGFIGAGMTIVITVTALTSFILPNYAFHQVIRFLSIPILLLGGILGFLGIMVGLMFGLAHLVSLRSFGVPYFSPVSPAIKSGWKDVFIRAPWWAMDRRPPGLGVDDIDRAGAINHTNPPKKRGED
jgi:hypothetical protein